MTEKDKIQLIATNLIEKVREIRDQNKAKFTKSVQKQKSGDNSDNPSSRKN